MKDVNEKYKEIIGLPPHKSKTHPAMSMVSRAAQFSAFAALTGFDDMIGEAARYTENDGEIDDDLKAVLQQKIDFLMKPENSGIRCTFTYFVPDGRKQGGKYERTEASVKKIDNIGLAVILDNGTTIPADRLKNIEGAIFDKYLTAE